MPSRTAPSRAGRSGWRPPVSCWSRSPRSLSTSTCAPPEVIAFGLRDSQPMAEGVAGRPWRLPMVARNTTEVERAATPLELFFDLCFVVAVAQASNRLHHAEAHGRAGSALVSYVLVFFA